MDQHVQLLSAVIGAAGSNTLSSGGCTVQATSHIPESFAQSVAYYSTSTLNKAVCHYSLHSPLEKAMATLATTPDSLAPLSQTIDTLMELCGGSTLKKDVMNYIVRWLGQSGRLKLLLVHILASEELAAVVALQSYGHNNSFMKLVLLRTKHGHQVRVHARWPNPDGFKEDLAHNHRADFASYMVAGALHFDILQECAEGSGACNTYRYIDHRPSGKDETVLFPQGPGLALFPEHNVPVVKGQSYYFDMHTLHRLVVPTGDTSGSLSIVLRNPRVRDYTTMLTAEERSSQVMPAIPSLTLPELCVVCSRLIHFFLC